MKMQNASAMTYRIKIDSEPGQPDLVMEVAPGAVCEMPDEYACRKSFLDGCCPGMIPYVEPDKEEPKVLPEATLEAPKAKKSKE
jgi:hypothetical protein